MQTTATEAPATPCIHPIIQFESGDYYLSCPSCQTRWAMIKPGQLEYGTNENGVRIGTAPELANKSPLLSASGKTTRHIAET